MNTQIDPLSYVRLPNLGIAGVISLAKILLHRVPQGPSPAIQNAASAIQLALVELETKWTRQAVPISRTDVRPLARQLDAMWSSLRDQLVTYSAWPEGHIDRVRAMSIYEVLFAVDGLAFLKLPFTFEHAESERHLRLIYEQGLAEDLEALVGAHFLERLSATHQAYGDALGINKATAGPMPAVLVNDQRRALAGAIRRYALRLVLHADDDPQQQDAVAFALAPIDEFRAAASRRAVANDDEDDGSEDDTDDPPVVVAPAAPAEPQPIVTD